MEEPRTTWSSRGINLAEISSSLLFTEVSHSLRSGIVHTHTHTHTHKHTQRVCGQECGYTLAVQRLPACAYMYVCVCKPRAGIYLSVLRKCSEPHYLRPARCELFRRSIQTRNVIADATILSKDIRQIPFQKFQFYEICKVSTHLSLDDNNNYNILFSSREMNVGEQTHIFFVFF